MLKQCTSTCFAQTRGHVAMCCLVCWHLASVLRFAILRSMRDLIRWQAMRVIVVVYWCNVKLCIDVWLYRCVRNASCFSCRVGGFGSISQSNRVCHERCMLCAFQQVWYLSFDICYLEIFQYLSAPTHAWRVDTFCVRKFSYFDAASSQRTYDATQVYQRFRQTRTHAT